MIDMGSLPGPDKFRIIYNNNKPIKLIGETSLNRRLLGLLSPVYQVEIARLEDVISGDKDTVNSYQYFAGVSDISFKKEILESTVNLRLNWITILSENSCYHPDLEIGPGTFINSYCNITGSNIKIGSHVYIAPYCCISENTEIRDNCFFSAFCYTNSCWLGPNSVLGVRTSLIGPYGPGQITVPAYTNIMANSTVTKSIDSAGTYYGNKKVNSETSLSQRIL